MQFRGPPLLNCLRRFLTIACFLNNRGKAVYTGSVVALVTPMLADGAIDYKRLEALLDWHIAQKTDGLVLLGTTGESATIHGRERAQLIEHVVAHVHGRLPVIVGTGSYDTRVAVELTQEAYDLGADAALLVTPYYNKPTQEGLYQHYSAVADAVPLPQILYNVPSRTQCDLLPSTVKRLASHANIIGIKEATGSLERLLELQGIEGLSFYSGDDGTACAFLQAGGHGVISVVANVVPAYCHDMCEAIRLGDIEKAKRCDEIMRPLYKALFLESNPIPVKWALQDMGLIDAGIRLPLTELSAGYRAQLREVLQAVGLSLSVPDTL